MDHSLKLRPAPQVAIHLQQRPGLWLAVPRGILVQELVSLPLGPALPQRPLHDAWEASEVNATIELVSGWGWHGWILGRRLAQGQGRGAGMGCLSHAGVLGVGGEAGS